MSLQLNPYLVFDGTCEEAFRFYARCLGGTLAPLSRFADTPGCEEFPAAYRDRIMHARLEIGGAREIRCRVRRGQRDVRQEYEVTGRIGKSRMIVDPELIVQGPD